MTTPITYHEELKRKAVHLSSLWMVLFSLLSPSSGISAVFFGILCATTLWGEHRYAAGEQDLLSQWYHRCFGKMLRQKPAQGACVVSGAAPVLAAACLANLLFVPVVAASSIAVMLLGDSAAALIGRRWGRHKIVNGKSLEGSLAFFSCRRSGAPGNILRNRYIFPDRRSCSGGSGWNADGTVPETAPRG